MRTNHAGITEKAEFKIDREQFGKELERIFGEKQSEFCELCEKRLSYCECECDKELKDNDSLAAF